MVSPKVQGQGIEGFSGASPDVTARDVRRVETTVIWLLELPGSGFRGRRVSTAMAEPVILYGLCAVALAGVFVHLSWQAQRGIRFSHSKVNAGTRAMGRVSITEPGGDHRALTQVSAGRIVSNRRCPESGYVKGVDR